MLIDIYRRWPRATCGYRRICRRRSGRSVCCICTSAATVLPTEYPGIGALHRSVRASCTACRVCVYIYM